MTQEQPFEEQRQHQRYPLMLAAEIATGEHGDGAGAPCVVFDISDGGAKVRLNSVVDGPAIAKDSAITLDVPLCADFRGTVMWTDDAYLGIRFTEPSAADVERVVEMSGRNAA